MTIKTFLVLGRLSNLPSIWTNIVAATLVAQASITELNAKLIINTQTVLTGADKLSTSAPLNQSGLIWFCVILCLSLMYIGGMFLNDAFDVQWDKKNKHSRPIVKGDISTATVSVIGSLLVGLPVLMLAYLYFYLHLDSSLSLDNSYGMLYILSLALSIVLYNVFHKKYKHCSLLMGACRAGVYLQAALLLSDINLHLVLAAIAILLYITGLTYLAQTEHHNKLSSYWPLFFLLASLLLVCYLGYNSIYFWIFLSGFIVWIGSKIRLYLFNQTMNVKACIGALLAAIPLLDGLLLASINAVFPSLVCVLFFLIILKLHKKISAT